MAWWMPSRSRTTAARDRLYRIRNLVEKPKAEDAPSNLAIIGRYVLTPEIFTSLETIEPGSGGEIQLTDGLKHMLRSRPIYGYKFEGKRYDAGDKQGFLQATVEFALKRHDLGASLPRIFEGPEVINPHAAPPPAHLASARWLRSRSRRASCRMCSPLSRLAPMPAPFNYSRAYRAAQGITPEYLEAFSWLTRAEFESHNYPAAEKFAQGIYAAIDGAIEEAPTRSASRICPWLSAPPLKFRVASSPPKAAAARP